MTVLDNDGYLYVMGGDENLNRTGTRVPRNDVWRSTFSLNDNTALSRACGVDVPACGVGLTCTPGANTRIVNGKVTCPAIDACTTDNLAFTVVTAHADWPARHSPGVEFLKKAFTVGGTSYRAGSMVMYGGTGPAEQLMNDVWLSSNGGLSWSMVPQTGTGFRGSAWSGHIVDGQSRIFKIGGERWTNPNTANGEVYMSTNAGQQTAHSISTISGSAIVWHCHSVTHLVDRCLYSFHQVSLGRVNRTPPVPPASHLARSPIRTWMRMTEFILPAVWQSPAPASTMCGCHQTRSIPVHAPLAVSVDRLSPSKTLC